MIIGVLGYHGSVIEHIKALKNCNVDAIEVRTKKDLAKCDGLIIPGGESTTLLKLMKREKIDEEIVKRAKDKKNPMPIYGTCAGAIIIARKAVDDSEKLQKSFGLIDIDVRRNAYGRQVESFENEVRIKNISDEKMLFHGVFIRAPRIIKVGKGVKILAAVGKEPVLVQHDRILAGTFHPELTDDLRIHKYFIEIVKKNKF